MVNSKKDDLCIYCGMQKKPPKGARFGTMEECIDKRQVRRYGLKKIDPDLIEKKKLEKLKKGNTLEDKIKKISLTLAGLNGKKSRLTKDLPYARTEEEKTTLSKELENVISKRKELIKELAVLKEGLNKK